MKKRWKVFWIVMIGMVVAGLVCLGVAIGLGFSWTDVPKAYPNGIGWVNDKVDDEDEEIDVKDITPGKSTKGVEWYTDVKDLQMDVPAGTIQVKTIDSSKSNVVGLKIRENGIDVQSGIDKDGTLIVKAKKRSGVNKRLSITVYIPKNLQLDSAKFSAGAGSMDVEWIMAKSLIFDVGAGEMKASDFRAETLKIDCGAGNVEIKGINTGNASIECGLGNVEYKMDDSTKEYTYDVNCGLGRVNLNGTKVTGHEKIRATDSSAPTIKIDCGVGNISIDQDN